MAAFRPDIQALRAVAVLLVVGFHVWPTRVQGGYIGVDVFFVISGYLITGHLVREVRATGRVDLPGFYARRARRLLPAASLTLVAVGVAAYALMPASTWRSTAVDMAASALYAQNWVLVRRAVDYLAQDQAPGPLQHFWSLAVEEQYYMVWPLLVAGVAAVWKRRRQGASATLVACTTASPPILPRSSSPPPPSRAAFAAPMAALCALSLAASAWYARTNPAPGYFMTHVRLHELGMGGLLAVCAGGGRRPQPADEPGLSSSSSTSSSAVLQTWLRTAAATAGLATIGMSAALFTARTPFPGAAALVPTLGATALLWAGDHQPNERAPPHALVPAMAHPWLQYIGDISYSLYLAHWPVVVMYPIATGKRVDATLADSALVLLISGGLAHACKRWWEDRFRVAGPSLAPVKAPAPPARPAASCNTLHLGVALTAVALLASGGLAGLAHWRAGTWAANLAFPPSARGHAAAPRSLHGDLPNATHPGAEAVARDAPGRGRNHAAEFVAPPPPLLPLSQIVPALEGASKDVGPAYVKRGGGAGRCILYV
jgi:peptidoglycan/LPS O-acetylase OafA/YrhL